MPSIQSTGGIFLRLDSSGNLNIYNTTGTSIAKFVGSAFSGSLAKGTAVSNVPITTTTSATAVATGNSNQITPQSSGNVLVIAIFRGSNSTAGANASFQLYQSTGTNNPAGGATPDGGAIGGSFAATSATASAKLVITFATIATGLTNGTGYTFECAIATVGGGTITIDGISLYVIEV